MDELSCQENSFRLISLSYILGDKFHCDYTWEKSIATMVIDRGVGKKYETLTLRTTNSHKGQKYEKWNPAVIRFPLVISMVPKAGFKPPRVPPHKNKAIETTNRPFPQNRNPLNGEVPPRHLLPERTGIPSSISNNPGKLN